MSNPSSILRWSLVAVWLLTAVVSLLERHGQSAALLVSGGVADAAVQQWLIGAGAALDAGLGLLLALRPRRWVYALAATSVLVMTAVATVLLPALWLHPLGPLSKNLPILAVLWVLWRGDASAAPAQQAAASPAPQSSRTAFASPKPRRPL